MAEISPQNPIVTALIGLASGGALTAIIARVVPSKKERLDDATAFRAELRAEIVQMQTRQDLQDLAYGKLQENYWTLFRDHAKLTAAHEILQAQHETLQREMLQLQAKVGIAPTGLGDLT